MNKHARDVALNPKIRADMHARGIDVDLSLDVLGAYNRGEYDHFARVEGKEIPRVDGSAIVDFTGELYLAVDRENAHDRITDLLPQVDCSVLDRLEGSRSGTTPGSTDDRLILDRRALRTLGLLLLPTVSYGVLNGGSATSYADTTRNARFSTDLLDLLRPSFEMMAQLSHDQPKGITPGYVGRDGQPGPSFLQLKMRNLLIQVLESRAAYANHAPGADGGLPEPLLPFFQMTSVHTDGPLRQAYDSYREDPILADLIAWTRCDPTQAMGRIQPLLAAFTHSDLGRPKGFFTRANGNEGETLPIPGGHGQNFAVLAEVYRDLRSQGKRFVYLGNVDNLGYLPDPVEVAYLALTGRPAGFDFALKTAVDVKGGILVRETTGRLNCADIGPAISVEEVKQAEASGVPILFNAASGLFDLEYLTAHLEEISAGLPTRIADQDKDAGRYAQAEQVTWEVLGMLDSPVVFGVSKWEKMLAAKLLLETLMTSGIHLDHPAYPTGANSATNLRLAARSLHDGLEKLLGSSYGMTLEQGDWRPIAAAELARRIEKMGGHHDR